MQIYPKRYHFQIYPKRFHFSDLSKKNTDELGYERLNGTRKIGPSYAKYVIYIWHIFDMHGTGTKHIVRHRQRSVIQWSVISRLASIIIRVPLNAAPFYRYKNSTITIYNPKQEDTKRADFWDLQHLQSITCLEKKACSFLLKNTVSCLCLTHTQMFTENTFRGLWLAEGRRPCYKWQITTQDLWVIVNHPRFPHSCATLGFPL